MPVTYDPEALPPLAAALLVELRRSNEALGDQMAEGHERIVQALTSKNDADQRRHAESLDRVEQQHGRVMLALRELDQDLDQGREESGAWRERMGAAAHEVWATFKGPLANLALALGAYLTWRFLGVPPTPTPVEVVQPVVIEAAPSVEVP